MNIPDKEERPYKALRLIHPLGDSAWESLGDEANPAVVALSGHPRLHLFIFLVTCSTLAVYRCNFWGGNL